MVKMYGRGVGVSILEIDGKLIEEALLVEGKASKKSVIEKALREFVERRKRKDLYDLFNSEEVMISDDYDYKSLRGGMNDDIS